MGEGKTAASFAEARRGVNDGGIIGYKSICAPGKTFSIFIVNMELIREFIAYQWAPLGRNSKTCVHDSRR